MGSAEGEAQPSVPIFWTPLRRLLRKRSAVWGRRHQAALRALVSNVHWTQARLHAHGLVASPVCRLCGCGKGTLYHSHYECDAHAALRRDHAPRELCARAARVRAWNDETA